MKRSLLVLGLLTAFAGLVLLTLDRVMGNPNLKEHGFNRTFKEIHYFEKSRFELDGNFPGIAGFRNDTLFLANDKPGELMAIDISTGSFKAITLSVPPIDKFQTAFQTIVDYPVVFIGGTNARKIVRGNLENNTTEVFDPGTGPLLGMAVVDSENVIIRCLDTVTMEMDFRRVKLGAGLVGDLKKVAPERTGGIFAYDGLLRKDPVTASFAYVNYYCNGIARFDSTLHTIERQKTIDTMNTPKVSVANLSTSITMDAPPLIVNKQCYIHNNIIYVNSALIADNEQYDLFNENAVIDTYNGEYAGSFYLPLPTREIRQFVVMDEQRIAVLSGGKLVIYSTIK